MTLPGQRLLSFPLAGPDAGRRPWSEGVQSVRETIWNILMTEPGERLMRPAFGAGLPGYLHQPNTESTRQIIADVARAAVVRNEPRVEVLDVAVRTDPRDPARVNFGLAFRLKATGAEDRLDLSLTLAGGA